MRGQGGNRKKRGGKKNDGVCLCQGLMRRVMPWIGCSVGSPWISLVQSGLATCDVERLSLAGHYSAVSHRTLPFMSARWVCITAPPPPPLWITHACICITIIRPPFISLHVSLFSLFIPFFFSSQANTHSSVFLCIAGAHIQANEKWQLCTLFAIQHLPRPPVSQKEGELHSQTPVSPLLLQNIAFLILVRSFFYDLKDISGSHCMYVVSN